MSEEPGTESARDQLAQQLRELRVSTGRSLKELERVTAASDSSLSRYLKGTSLPPWSVVESLCRAAGREPAPMRELWQDARREQVGQRAESVTSDEPLLVPPAAGGADGVADGPPVVSARRWGRPSRQLLALLVAAVVIIGTVVSAVAWSLANGGDADAERLCPWQYIVTDGDPSPVIISDHPGKGRYRIGTYLPSQIFWAYEPVQADGGMMRTTEGWITQGDWIRRYPKACKDR